MPKMRIIAALLAAVVAYPALAQAPKNVPTRIRGTVIELAGQSLAVASRDGTKLMITLAPNFSVLGVVKKELADLKPGDFVGITSLTGSDGRQHAVEVHILPQGLRGVVAEEQLPWDLMPHALMTNAIVARVATEPKEHVLQVTFKGGAADIVLGPQPTIVGYVPGDPSLLRPGAAIFVVALKGPDGTLKAARVTAEKDGVKPPL